MEFASEGDIIVVWRLDRLGRSLLGLVNMVTRLVEKKVEFRSLTESIDTTSSTGKLCFHMIAAMAEFERNLISERTKAGLSAARLRGKRLGRPRALSEQQIQMALNDLAQNRKDIRTICKEYNVSERTFKRYVDLGC